MDAAVLDLILQLPKLREAGHGADLSRRDLGLGWLYYALVRMYQPARAVVIGSWRGFVPVVVGHALQENGGGELIFIDPSMADAHWKDPDRVRDFFGGFGLAAIVHHYCMTTQDFVRTPIYETLRDVGFLFVDGMHTREQARFDHMAFADKLLPGAPVLFHDSRSRMTSTFYREPYVHAVHEYIAELRTADTHDVVDFPLAMGVALAVAR